MQSTYEQQFSERALEVLALIKEPTSEEVWKQRKEILNNNAGTTFDEILNSCDLSMHQLRKIMREELYGVLGVFYKTLTNITHSPELVSTPVNIDIPVTFERFDKTVTFRMQRTDYSAADQALKEGFTLTYRQDGSLYRNQTKPKKPSQVGFFIPEAIQQEYQWALDHEDRLFEKTIQSDSLPILKHILERSQELRQRHGNNWYPYFGNKTISDRTGIPFDEVKEATADLTGIIAEGRMLKTRRAPRSVYFLPSVKYADCAHLVYR